jgi:multidrug efflux pump subunit AcrB
VLRLGDVARVELGGESYGVVSRYNGKPAAGVAVIAGHRRQCAGYRDRVRRLLERDVGPTSRRA